MPPSESRRARILWRWSPILLIAFLTGVYLLNGDFLIGDDAKASVYLPDQLLHHGSFAFTPSSAPFMFVWQYASPAGPAIVRIDDWQGQIGSTPLRDLYARGALSVLHEKYYLTPSTRRDPATHERMYVNTFGPGPGVCALPAFTILEAIAGDLGDQPWWLWYGGKFVAALLAACSAGVVFLIARRFVPNMAAMLIALTLGLGTSLWSVSSQTLWQHAPNAFFLSFGFYCLARWHHPASENDKHRADRRWPIGCGACLACAVVCRPTSFVYVICVGIYLLIASIAEHARHRPPHDAGEAGAPIARGAFARFVLGGAPIAILLGFYNFHYLGAPWRFGQTEAGKAIAEYKTGSPAIWQTPFHVGMSGLLVSPGRGLFVYSPVLLFAIAGAWLAWRDRRWRFLRPLTLAAILVIAIEGRHYDWWGGWSWSYRKIVDITPVLALLLMPIIGAVLRRRWAVGAYLALLAISMAIQFVGAFAFDLDGWNARAVEYVQSGHPHSIREVRLDIDERQNRARLWSWGDNPIAWYFAHFRQSRARREREVKAWLKNPAQ